MEKYTGKSIFKGIAIGKILFYQKGEQPVKRVKIEDTAEQIKRYEDARAKAAEQLQGLYEKALKEVGEANAAVFEVHQMMLEDEDYQDAIRNMIRDNKIHQIDGVISSSPGQMRSMDQSLFELYKNGRITKETAINYAMNPEMLRKRLG